MSEAQQRITILGSTGSIGVSTLDVIRRHASRWQVFALAANSSVTALLRQCEEFTPRYAVLRDAAAAAEALPELPDDPSDDPEWDPFEDG